MKKLIAMIGAVATAFGLYATELTNTAVSFESSDPGCSGETLDLTKDALWSTDYDDVFKFGAYGDDEAAYDYEKKGTTRGTFPSLAQQTKYLKLSTGTNSLQRLFAAKVEDAETDVSTDPIFMDQLVKFTGYEDTQTVFAAGTKVAVWMSEFVTNETADAEQTLTNLYVAVGKVAGPEVTVKNVKIAGDYKLDTWYRLTIRSIGNIIGETQSQIKQLNGFAIYIDGQPLSIVAEDRVALLDIAAALIPKAKVLYNKGQLFPSMVAGSTTLKSVGFEGMGGIDDMIVDAVGPDFAQEANFTVTAPEGAVVTRVYNVDDEADLVADANGVYTVVPGTNIKIWLTADNSGDSKWVLKPDPTIVDKTVAATDKDIDLSDEVTPESAVVQVVIGDEDAKYFSELGDAFAFIDGTNATVSVEMLDEGAYWITEGVGYAFFKGTTIDINPVEEEEVLDGVWNLYVDNAAEDEEKEISATDTFGVMPEKVINVTFNEGGFLKLAGNIYGYGRKDAEINVDGATTLVGALTIGAAAYQDATGVGGAVLKTDALTLDGNKITLKGKGKVMVKTALTVADAFTNDEKDIKVTEPTEVGGYYTYALKQGAAFTINPVDHATITCEGATWDATLQKWVAPKAGDDVEVTVTADDGYLFADGSDKYTETIQAVDGETFTLETPAPTKAKVQKGLKFFITLKDALDDDATEGAITLLADATLDNYTLTKAVVLNLGGFNLTGGTSTTQHKIFTLLDGAALTINAKDSIKDDAEVITGNIYLGVNKGESAVSLTLNGGKYQQAAGVNEAVIQVNGGDTGVKTITAENCKFTSTDDTFYLAGPATTTLENCVVIGATGIYAKSGTITLDDTDVVGNGVQQEPVANGNGARSTGDAVIFDTITGYVGNMTLNVEGLSELTSDNGYAFQETVTRGTESGTLTVTIADTATVGAVKLSDQFAAKVAAGSASITGYVATVNGIAYKTAAEALVAVQAAEAAGDVKVNAIAALAVTTPDEQTLTIAAGGTITVTSAGWALTGTVTGNVNLALGKTLSVPEGTVITVNPPAGYRVAKSTEGGITTYSIEEIPYIAKNTTTEEQYKDLATAISEAADGNTIQLIANSEFEFDGEGVRVAGKAITLDLNGKKLTGKANMPAAPKEQRMICVASDGDLTVLDSTVAEGGYGAGELHFEYINSGTPKYSAGYYLILNTGKLTVKSGKLTARDYADHTKYGEGDLVYAIENRSNGNSAELVIEGGYISVPDHNGQCAVRLYAYDNAEPKYVNKATITGGILDNVYPFCMTVPHQGACFDVNISGGTFNGYTRLKGDNYGYSRVNITGGIFNGNAEGFDIQDDNATRENLPWLFISGGTFEQYKYLSKYIGPTKDNTLITGGIFNKLGKADVDPQNIEALLTPSIPAYAAKKDVDDAHFTAELIAVPLTVAKADGVDTFTYTVNGKEPAANQTVVFGDWIVIEDITYAEGYKAAGEVKKGDIIIVNEEDIAAGKVDITIDAQLKTFTVTVEASNATLKTNDYAVVGNSFTAAYGTEYTLTAAPADGYKDATIKIGDVDVTSLKVTEDVTIVVAATKMDTWTVTVDTTLGEHVATLTANPTEVREDAESKEVTLTATFENDYELDYFTVDGAKIEGNTFSIAKSVTVNAVAKAKSSEPIPPLPENPTDEQKQAAVDAVVAKNAGLAGVVTKDNYSEFRTWARGTGTDPLAAEDAVLKSDKAAVSFQLSPIVQGATLFTNEPAVKFTAIEQGTTGWNATLQIKDGATGEEVQLAVEEAAAAYQNFVKVGTEVGSITQAATITATAADTVDGKQVILTVTPPTGDKGFIKFTTATK